MNRLGTEELKSLFQMPRSEITHIIETTYGICSSYSVVLCAVTEQVANFHETKYGTDAFTDEEADFEDMLYCDQKTGFMLIMQEEIKEDVVEAFLHYMVKLGGPKLLARAPPPRRDADCSSSSFHEGGDEDAAAATESSSNQAGPSFRSDRRIIRLLIGRFWADRIISQYTEYINLP